MTIDCPKCEVGELTFSVTNDYQGDGAWGQVVEFVELENQTCDCDIPEEQMEALTEQASIDANDYDPANDVDIEWEEAEPR